MIKSYRIKHEGFHRVGISLGVIFVIFMPGLLLAELMGYNLYFEFTLIIDRHIDLIQEIVEEGPQFIFLFLIYPVTYFVGYSIPKVIYWVISGFNE